MEKDRTIIAIVLMLVVVLVYFQIMGPKPQPAPPSQEGEPRPVQDTQEQPAKTPDTPAPPVPQDDVQEPSEPPVAEEHGRIRTSTLDFEWSNVSAAFAGITITASSDGRYLYPDHTRENPLRLLFSENEADFALRLCKPDSVEDVAAGNWTVVKSDSSEIVMETALPGGLRISKQFTFVDDSYHVLFEIKLHNSSETAISPSYRVLAANGLLEEVGRRNPGGAVVAQTVGGKVKVTRTAPSKLTDESPSKKYTAGGAWAAIENMYFAAVLAPEDRTTSDAIDNIIIERAFESQEEQQVPDPENPRLLNMRVILTSKQIPLEPGETRVHRYLYFAGPKHPDVLEQYKNLGFDQLLDYGWFGFLSKMFLWILRGVYYIFPNWGIAIIILTLLVRACLHPVSRKSQMTMQKYQRAMQQLKPKLDKLKEKHKNNREKLTKETMKLYKEEGVSMFPAGGCLLMLLQIPVFIGLYWGLSLSIELRQASFVFWINDLSQPDAAFTLSSNIPLLGTPFVNILPVFMLAAMVFQQKTQPRAADPQQAQQQKMTMYIMMFVIGFIFYNMPSGLVLYFLTSTLVGIAESKLIKRKLSAESAGK